MTKDPDFLKKLPLYKTAYSPLYETYVGIVKVRYDDLGEPILDCRVAGHDADQITLFRVCELENFVL
jgi:hypothetical protein